MTEGKIFTSSAERLRSLAVPTEMQKIAVIRTPFVINGEFILLGKRHQGHLIALFPNSKSDVDEPNTEQKLSNGFKISELKLLDPETQQPSYFLELCNVGNIDEYLFGALLDELLKEIDQGSDNLIEKIKAILEKWKNMLSLDSERVLSMNALVGLFGELVLLEYLVNEKNLAILDNWVGPLGNRHDYEFDKHSIEVKSTTLKNKEEIKVHGVNQLEAYPGKDVTILRIKLELDPHGTSLTTLVERIMKSPKVSEAKFREKLLKVGYKEADADAYRSIGFQTVEFHLVPVNEKFPRITAGILLGIDPLDRINEIEYSVNVSGLSSKISTNLADLNLEKFYE
jgi:hypothetical protein